ncbi:hypothetical protein [Aquirufa nivalisilvae]
MKYRIIEKALQIGIFLGMVKILIEIFNLLFLPNFFINQWYIKFFIQLTFLGFYIFLGKEHFHRWLISSHKMLTIFIILQLSTIMICGFEIYIHHSFDRTYKNRIADIEVQKLKTLDEKFQSQNNARIINTDEFYQTKKYKILENYSVKYLLSRFCFSFIGNLFLMFMIKFLIDFFKNPIPIN